MDLECALGPWICVWLRLWWTRMVCGHSHITSHIFGTGGAGEVRNRWTLLITVLAAVTIGLIGGGVALGTPGSDITSALIARGTAEEKVKTRGNQPYDVVVQTNIITAGGHTGWHTHPGMAVAVVKTGTLTIYHGDDRTCTGQTFAAGQVFIDQGYGHVHIGRNEGATTLEIVVTFLDVPIGQSARIDVPNPGHCSF
jgi:quercetin dioxygenase-like cupin family protein